MVSAYAIEQIQVSAFCVPSTKSVSSKHCCRRDLFTVYSQKRHEHVSQTNKIFAASTPTTSNADTSISMQSEKSTTTRFQSMLCAIALAVTTASSTSMTTEAGTAFAYIPSDYASETVTTVIQDLKSASGKNEATFNVYENIAGIITEGKGVGGMINYKGIELERGFVADEDTTIYNPGLSLLTESEKERLVEGVINARKDGLAKGQWSENNQFAYQFLKEKLDPLHTVELSGFLKIVPYYGAFLYVAVLGAQQFFRGTFQVAYIVGVAAFLLPIAVLIALGP